MRTIRREDIILSATKKHQSSPKHYEQWTDAGQSSQQQIGDYDYVTPYKYKNQNINNSTGGYISGSRQIQKDHKKDSSFTNERQDGI